MLVWRRFGVPLFPICAPLFPIRVPLVPICVTPSTSSPTNIFCCYPPPISRYFCKDSLMTPPTHHPLQASFSVTLSHPIYHPLQKFSWYHFLHFPFVFHSCSLVFHSCSLVFTRVHSCSFMFHSCSLVFIRVPLVFTRVHSCSIHVHSCSFVIHSCSLVFIRVHSCSIRVPIRVVF